MDDQKVDDRAAQDRENAARRAAFSERDQGGEGENQGRKLEFTNEPDQRSPEEQANAVDEHNRRATDQMREHTDRAMQLPDHLREYRGPFHGGQPVADTRGRPTRFQEVGLNVLPSPQERAKRQLAEESGGRPGGAPSRAETLAYDKNQSDPTARAEVIARG